MSKQETQSQITSDIFATYKQNVTKYFENVEKIVPQYFQSIELLQEECVRACENTIKSTIELQQEFARKSGLTTDIPDTAKKVLVDSNKQIVQTSNVQNQIAKTTIDATIQSIKSFNDNATAFADLNKNIIQSWMSVFTLKN